MTVCVCVCWSAHWGRRNVSSWLLLRAWQLEMRLIFRMASCSASVSRSLTRLQSRTPTSSSALRVVRALTKKKRRIARYLRHMMYHRTIIGARRGHSSFHACGRRTETYTAASSARICKYMGGQVLRGIDKKCDAPLASLLA